MQQHRLDRNSGEEGTWWQRSRQTRGKEEQWITQQQHNVQLRPSRSHRSFLYHSFKQLENQHDVTYMSCTCRSHSPGLNLMRALPLVVVPSGNISIWTEMKRSSELRQSVMSRLVTSWQCCHLTRAFQTAYDSFHFQLFGKHQHPFSSRPQFLFLFKNAVSFNLSPLSFYQQ